MSLDTFSPPVAQLHRSWPQPRRQPNSAAILALLLTYCLFLFFYGLTTGELYRTESLRAIIAAEFLRSGNWVVPTLYGEPLFTKPPGMYAAIALVSWPFGGVTEWTARMPSAHSATAAVFLAFWYFRRHLGLQGGLIAAAILPASFMWLDKATSAEIDMVQAAWVTAAIFFFLRGLEAAEATAGIRTPQGIRYSVPSTQYSVLSTQYSVVGSRYSNESTPLVQTASSAATSGLMDRARPSSVLGWWLAALFCVAGGVFTKWTSPAFFYFTIVPLLWWRGRLRLLLSWPHLLAANAGAGLCLAWVGFAIAQTGWHPFYDTVSREALMRLLPSHYYKPYPWHETLLHPVKVLLTNFPWSLFALLTLRPGFFRLWEGNARRLLQALHCWTWPNLFFWTLIPEHAIRHSFPFFPGIAGLAAFVCVAWLRGEAVWPRWGFGRLAASLPWATPGRILAVYLALWLVVKLVFVHAVIPARNLHREPRAKGQLLARLVPAGEILYLFRLKDEGIMFYYGGAVRRLSGPAQLPSSSQPLYCILDESEWRSWQSARPAQALQELTDEQGAPIVLVKVPPRE
jgi:4-amino-4-deoxy-L-arabinose transferase-like glycosyltransferase